MTRLCFSIKERKSILCPQFAKIIVLSVKIVQVFLLPGIIHDLSGIASCPPKEDAFHYLRNTAIGEVPLSITS